MPPFFIGGYMILKLSKNNDAPNVIKKTLSGVQSFDVALRRDFDITAPEFTLNIPDAVTALGFNYAELPDFNRRYFIQSVDNVGATLWRFTCKVDVLETYKTEILASNAKIRRGIKTGDYISATLESNANADITTHEADKGFVGEPALILSTVGNSGA